MVGKKTEDFRLPKAQIDMPISHNDKRDVYGAAERKVKCDSVRGHGTDDSNKSVGYHV